MLLPRFHTLRSTCACLISMTLLMVIGCTSHQTIEAAAEQGSNLKPIATLYGQYIGQHRGRPPASEEAFREFIEKEGSAIMESYGIASVDELLVSERDGQPYVIVYAGQPKPTTQSGSVVAYEQQGVEGKIFVTDDLGDVRQIPAADLIK